MRRSYKFRIYPTAGQARRAAQCLRDHQRLYNAALEERREAWRMGKVGIRYGQQSAQLKDIRALDRDQGRWSFSSQQATLRRLDKAMAAFYRRCKAAAGTWSCPATTCRPDRSPRPAARSALMSAWHGSRPPATAR